jgi:hypothetical protein
MRPLTTNCRCRTVLLGGLLAGLLTGLLTGCGQHEPGVEVQGKVLVGARPLTTGIVIFQPDATRGNAHKHEARGTIDAQGNYILTPDRGGRKVPPGWYRVVVVSTKKNPRNEYAMPISLIPRTYSDPRTSGLHFEVKETAATGTYDIKLGG